MSAEDNLADFDWGFIQASLDESRVVEPHDPFKKMLARFPAKLAEALRAFRCGEEAAERGDHPAALQAFSDGLRLEATLPGPYISRGRVLSELKRFDEAIADFSRALALHPLSKSALRGRALAHRMNGNGAMADADELQIQKVDELTA